MLASDPNPLVNTVSVQYNPEGFPNEIKATASDSVAVKRPVADIEITKTADALSKVGDSVTYTFRICNVGDILVTRGTVTDTLLGRPHGVLPGHLGGGPVCDGRADAHGGSR